MVWGKLGNGETTWWMIRWGLKDVLNTNDRHSHASRRNIMRRNIEAGNCSSLKKHRVFGKK